MIGDAYAVVSTQMLRPEYFNDAFYRYISNRFVAEGNEELPTAQGFLERSPAHLAEQDDDRADELGICKAYRYCLGYSGVFHSSKPRLTDLLLALIAARKPFDSAIETINEVQGTSPDCCCLQTDPNLPRGPQKAQALKECREQEIAVSAKVTPGEGCKDCVLDPRAEIRFSCSEVKKDHEKYSRCIAIVDRLALRKVNETINYLDPAMDCTTADQWGILRSQFTRYTSAVDWRPRFHLACFARAAQIYFKDAGLARAAVADFLFQYKRSQQYPHEFIPYYLSQSAANLNSVLSPIIDAFNRDVVAFQTYMRTDLEYEVEVADRGNDHRCCVKRLFSIGKPSFFNDGIVSVRTISGQTAQVKGTSQSFLDASKAPSLSDLMAAVGSGATPGSASPLAAVLGATPTQAPVSLLSGILGSYQKTYAQIGRTLQLQAVPRSLATASAAEISVYMQAADPASTPTYSGGPPSAQQQNTSEVSNHEVSTRIRIDSLKLFELSSYSAVLQRARSKFPLVPPFVEIPYIGTLAGIPLGAAKEYHQSTAVISAMVVPTAADIGYGLRFGDDWVLYGPPGTCSLDGRSGPLCQVRKALSTSDLHAPVERYHDSLMLCFTTETTPGRENLAPATATGRKFFTIQIPPSDKDKDKNKDVCEDLTFKNIPYE